MTRTWQQVVVAAVLCVVLVAAPSCHAAAEDAALKYAAPALPAFENFFAQQFRVSVVTQSYGVFNASLRMRGSLNFPERVQGELIPIGEPKVHRQTQKVLPHFKRTRGVEDDKLSALPFSAMNKQGGGAAGKGTSSEFTVAGEEERPSLLVLDLQLQHSDAKHGKAQVYYLPADLLALRSRRERISEGAVAPAATVDFTFRMEAARMSDNPLSDVPALARVSAASVLAEAAKDAAALKGTVVFRWITEHEFSAVFSAPILSTTAEGKSETHLERISVYGYAAPSPNLYNRKQRQVPWYNKYLMLGVGLTGFFMQIISGWTEGKTKAIKAEEEEKQQKALEQAKLEAAIKEQERHKKKK